MPQLVGAVRGDDVTRGFASDGCIHTDHLCMDLRVTNPCTNESLAECIGQTAIGHDGADDGMVSVLAEHPQEVVAVEYPVLGVDHHQPVSISIQADGEL